VTGERGDGMHVAIIMDGNGRWAQARGRPRLVGHRAGAAAVRRAVEAAGELGVGTLTLFAFSADNWRRPPREVRGLMLLITRFLRTERERLAQAGVRVSAIGRRDRLPPALLAAVESVEAATREGRGLHLRVALDYSSRDAILDAARRLPDGPAPGRAAFARALGDAEGPGGGAPDVDLLVRTGGEQRLSDFLLWECAYAEMLFTPRMWPDFDRDDLAAAVGEFRRRERRFGALAGV
jgi:undecaprenyl diphosphate synthase